MSKRYKVGDSGNEVDYDRYRKTLAIRREYLEDCCVEQPDLFHNVADAYVLAAAERDAIELDLKEATAEEDDRIRRKAAEAEEKLTEGAIKNLISGSKRIKDLNRAYLSAKMEADRWSALKDSFKQRKDMLQQLVPISLSRQSGSVVTAYREAGEVNRARTSGARMDRRRVSE